MLLRPFIILCVVLGLAAPAMAQMMPGDANSFSGKDAATSIAQALSKAGAGDDVKVSIYGAGDDSIIATASSAISAQVDNVELDKNRNGWNAVLLLTADGKNLAPVRLSGHYDEMTQLPVLKRRIQSGEVISMDDIDWSQWPSAHLRKSTITDPKDLVGKSPKRIISQGRPIREDEVANPAIINKGAHITLIYKTPSIEIKTLGEALDNGAKGDVIRVKNITSKSVIEGPVEGDNSVRVSAPENTSAEAM